MDNESCSLDLVGVEVERAESVPLAAAFLYLIFFFFEIHKSNTYFFEVVKVTHFIKIQRVWT